MNNNKNIYKISKNMDKGITLMALVITIVVLLIIAGIGINTGTESLEKVKLEELKTNMLLIEAKAREYVEEANFKIGKETTDQNKIEEIKKEVYENGEKGAKLQKAIEANLSNVPADIPIDDCYVVTQETLELWGLNKIELYDENERYLVKFDETNLKVEVYNTRGYQGKYSLTEIEQ